MPMNVLSPLVADLDLRALFQDASQDNTELPLKIKERFNLSWTRGS